MLFKPRFRRKELEPTGRKCVRHLKQTQALCKFLWATIDHESLGSADKWLIWIISESSKWNWSGLIRDVRYLITVDSREYLKKKQKLLMVKNTKFLYGMKVTLVIIVSKGKHAHLVNHDWNDWGWNRHVFKRMVILTRYWVTMIVHSFVPPVNICGPSFSPQGERQNK